MKNEKSNRSTSITYQGVFEELGISKEDLDKRAYENKTIKIRNHVKSILESWKSQKYINNFEEYRNSKKITGVKLHF